MEVSNDPEEQKQLENVGILKSIILKFERFNQGKALATADDLWQNRESRIATIPIGLCRWYCQKLGKWSGICNYKE